MVSKLLVVPGWYRFVEPAGTSLPLAPHNVNGEQCNICQTTLSAWVHERRNPSLGDGAIDITLCFRNSCSKNLTGQAVACKDAEADGQTFYLYYLPTVKVCNTAYCAL